MNSMYCIPMRALTAVEQQRHMENLTLSPEIAFGQAEMLRTFVIAQGMLCMPRHYGVRHYGTAARCNVTFGDALPAGAFKGTLTTTQRLVQDEVERIMAPGNKTDAFPRGGTLAIHCGGGKTVLCIALLLNVVRRKGIILVHKQELLAQWCERLCVFAPHLKVGIMQGKTFDKGCDVLVAMIQTLARREVSQIQEEVDRFGFMCVDEAHHVACATTLDALAKLRCAYTLGLSATPERRDNMHSAIFNALGPILYRIDPPSNQSLHVRMLRIKNQPYIGGDSFTTMLSDLVADERRNRLLVSEIVRLVRDQNRDTIVLSDRRAQLQRLKDMLLEHGLREDEIGLLLGGPGNRRERDAAKERKILLTSMGIAREGLDIARMSALVFATPLSCVTQAIGRVQRRPDVCPVVVDIVDAPYNMARSMARKRENFYKSKEYRVEYVGVDL